MLKSMLAGSASAIAGCSPVQASSQVSEGSASPFGAAASKSNEGAIGESDQASLHNLTRAVQMQENCICHADDDAGLILKQHTFGAAAQFQSKLAARKDMISPEAPAHGQ